MTMSATGFIETSATSWGRVDRRPHFIAAPRFADELPALVEGVRGANRPMLCRGLGRSYGDSGLNPGGALIEMRRLDRFISFDAGTGLFRAEAGANFSDILRFLVPRGWFLPTVPGTRFVTLAGAIANDVHGKNHHAAATFGAHVQTVRLRRSDGSVREIDKERAPDLFAATVGGLGLTGVIEEASVRAVRVPSSFIDVETISFGSLDGFFELARESAEDFEFTVAWVDCSASAAALGRGIFQRARWSPNGGYLPHSDSTRLSVPVDAPSVLLNPLTLKAFNSLYFGRQSAIRKASVRRHYAPFLFPLDSLLNWNRLYGPAGFYQYQSVVPPDAAHAATRDMLAEIQRCGEGSVLAVLKTFGPGLSPGVLSFPREGLTLALDFRNRASRTMELLARLDAIVTTAGGRLYPAKDGRIPGAMFRRGWPNLDVFRQHVDPAMSSAFWRRVSCP